MESLLDKVRKIEEEASRIVSEADAAGSARVRELVGGEERVLQDVRSQAVTTGEKIQKEKLMRVKDKLNRLKQDADESVRQVEKLAVARRDEAVTQVLDWLNKDISA